MKSKLKLLWDTVIAYQAYIGHALGVALASLIFISVPQGSMNPIVYYSVLGWLAFAFIALAAAEISIRAHYEHSQNAVTYDTLWDCFRRHDWKDTFWTKICVKNGIGFFVSLIMLALIFQGRY